MAKMTITITEGNEFLKDKVDKGGNEVDTGQTLRDDINSNQTSIEANSTEILLHDGRLGELEGISLVANHALQEIYIKNQSGVVLATLNVAFLNNEGTSFIYNDTTKKLELRNDANELLAEVPVGDFVGNLAKSITLVGNRLSLKDTTGAEISFVEFEITNINGLSAALNAKANKSEVIAGIRRADGVMLVPDVNRVVDLPEFSIENEPQEPKSFVWQEGDGNIFTLPKRPSGVFINGHRLGKWEEDGVTPDEWRINSDTQTEILIPLTGTIVDEIVMDTSEIVQNSYVNSSGNFQNAAASNPPYSRTGKLLLPEGATHIDYFGSLNLDLLYIGFYDEAGVLISVLNRESTTTVTEKLNIPIPSGAKQVAASVHGTSLQLVAKVPTSSGDYIEFVFDGEGGGGSVASTTEPVQIDTTPLVLDSYVANTGAFVAATGYSRTGKLPIPNDSVSIDYFGNWDNPALYIAFYDIDGVFISSVGWGGSPISEKLNIPIPQGATQVAASCTGTGPINLVADVTVIFENYDDTEVQNKLTDHENRITTLENSGTGGTSYDDTEVKARITTIENEIGVPIGTDLVAKQGVAMVLGKYITTSGTVSSSSNFAHTDYVELDTTISSFTYRGNWTLPTTISLAFYDVNKVFISIATRGADPLVTTNIPIPENAVYLRASREGHDPIKIETEQLFSEISDKIESLQDRTSVVENGLDLATYPTGTNIIPVESILTGGYIKPDGGVRLEPGTGYLYTEFVPIPRGLNSLTYKGRWINGAINQAFYDKDKVFISTVTYPSTATYTLTGIQVPTNAVYLRFSSWDNQAPLEAITENVSDRFTRTIERHTSEINGLTTDLYDPLHKTEPADLISRSYAEPYVKLPNFYKRWLAKEEDCNVVILGTSMSRGSQYASDRPDGATRPIYCHSNDLCGNIWDKLVERWNDQQYRRYDSGYFTETGTWATKVSDATWDDGAKDIRAKASMSADASLQFTVPIDSWAFRFVYKSEANGDTCTVTVAEGNGLLQVYDVETSTWAEANGYVFSTHEPHDATAVTGKPYGDYSDGYGNTIYGKRLKFRSRDNLAANVTAFDTRTTAKTVTITKSSDTTKRLTYWGVEWSPRGQMLTLTNGSRASFSYRADENPQNYNHAFYVKSDMSYFEPSLLMFEISKNRWGSSAYERVGWVERMVFNLNLDGTPAGQPLSIKEVTNNFEGLDLLFYNPSTSTGSFNEDGSLDGSIQTSGVYPTNGVKFTQFADAIDGVAHHMITQRNSYALADTHGALREAAVKYYGSYYEGFKTSSASGYTLIADGIHWNDRGAAVVAKAINSWFIF